jgi:hypothetical protein
MIKFIQKHTTPIIVFSVVIIGAILIFIKYAPIITGTFSTSAWDKYPHFRYRMIDDMEERMDIWNRSRSEIFEILGTEGVNPETEYIGYLIRRTIYFDEDYYCIVFSDEGKVEHIYIAPGSH